MGAYGNNFSHELADKRKADGTLVLGTENATFFVGGLKSIVAEESSLLTSIFF